MKKCNAVSHDLMRLFAIGLEMEDEEWFSKCHDIERGDCMSTLRCIHYHDTYGKALPEGYWRAGYTPTIHKTPFPSSRLSPRHVFFMCVWGLICCSAHTDFDVLTLLFQKQRQSGLEICPGRGVSTSFAHDDVWTPINFPTPTTIICNIGDMLMHISSDRFKSTFHRVRPPARERRGRGSV